MAGITDEGQFELLATAVLREANPIYASLVHPGLNVDGKTVKSPLDGICFEKGADPTHIVAVHHTTTSRDDLEKKWLHDPSTVKPRKGLAPTAPAGDLLKTAEIVAKERQQHPRLRATLVLTTNQEPDESLVRKVQSAGRDRGLEIDIWPRSRLSHFLDNSPSGQWLRRSHLGIEQEQLSCELFRELSDKSIKTFSPPDDPAAWVSREIDASLTSFIRRGHDVTFVVAGSGMGKSVACYRLLENHLKHGGFGIVVPHDVIALAMSIEQAVAITLGQLHPQLSATAVSPLSFCSPDQTLLLVVEDVNRSGRTQQLVTKLAGWNRAKTLPENGAPSAWHLVCPLWPEVFATLAAQERNRIESLMLSVGGFRESEGSEAIMTRARISGQEVSPLTATAISRALGDDPLLIALHDLATAVNPTLTITRYVDGCLSRVAAELKDNTAQDFRHALRRLAGRMLATRQVDPTWGIISSWPELQGDPISLLSRLAHQGELIRLAGASDDQQLMFRHHRVREWILADAISDMDRQGALTESILAEPFFSEVMGAALVFGNPKPDFLQRIGSLNPLALFHAIRLLGNQDIPARATIISAINSWLDDPAAHDLSRRHLRWEAMAMLAETDSVDVPALANRFKNPTISTSLARFRNGDLDGGIELCAGIDPGMGAPWRDVQIEHAKLRYGPKLICGLENILRRADLSSDFRVGALRLAGHIGEGVLAPAIEACWGLDDQRNDQLADYLWAFAECCAEDPARYLGPVCDAWAALPDESERDGLWLTRNNLAAHSVRWAFRKWPPVSALDYFMQRGAQDPLKWPITYMLHGLDHPKAVSFVVQELAAMKRRMEGTESYSPFALTASDEWRRAQEDKGRPMSKASRELLLGLWQDESRDKHLRTQAFSLWAATKHADDLAVLHAVQVSDMLADSVLRERLNRGDQKAIPELVKKLATDKDGFWWQYGRNTWSADLNVALDEYFGRRGVQAKRVWCECLESDMFTPEIVMRLPAIDAERMLLKHWTHLRYSPYFVQTALYVATPRLRGIANAAIGECPTPSKLLEHVSMHFGIMRKGHPGITNEAQIQSLAPHLDLLSPMDVRMLWDECNRRGWLSTRREILDHHLQPRYCQHMWDRDRAVSELDKMVSERGTIRITYWIDGFMKSGVSWGEIVSTMMQWLQARRTIEALQIIAIAFGHCGTRADLSALTTIDKMPEGADLIVSDTVYAVRRRSIR